MESRRGNQNKNRLRLWPLLAAALFFVLGFFAGKGRTAQPSAPIVSVDTVYTRDTILVEKIITDRKQIGYLNAQLSLAMAEIDSLKSCTSSDTIVVSHPLPLEEVSYRSDEAYIVATGYKPQITHVELYPKITTITKTEKLQPPKWSIGVTAGPGILLTPAGNIYGGLGLTIGVQYRF